MFKIERERDASQMAPEGGWRQAEPSRDFNDRFRPLKASFFWIHNLRTTNPTRRVRMRPKRICARAEPSWSLQSRRRRCSCVAFGVRREMTSQSGCSRSGVGFPDPTDGREPKPDQRQNRTSKGQDTG